jgi:hypothetical protein
MTLAFKFQLLPTDGGVFNLYYYPEMHSWPYTAPRLAAYDELKVCMVHQGRYLSINEYYY